MDNISNELIEDLEKVFCIKFHQWQKDYLQSKENNMLVVGARNQKVFTIILKMLLITNDINLDTLCSLFNNRNKDNFNRAIWNRVCDIIKTLSDNQISHNWDGLDLD